MLSEPWRLSVPLVQVALHANVMVMFVEQPGLGIKAAASEYDAAPPHDTRWLASQGSLMLTLLGYDSGQVRDLPPVPRGL